MVKEIVSRTGATDPVGILLTGIVGIASLFGIFTWLNWTPEQVGMFLSFLGMLATGGRTIWKSLKAEKLPASFVEATESTPVAPE